jgi:hypothetical protein
MVGRWIGVLLALGLVFGAGAAAANQFVVVASTEAAWKPGQIVPAGTTFDLPAGAKVTLVGADGSRVNIRGPYRGAPAMITGAAGSGQMLQQLAQLVSRDRTETSALGATRAGADLIQVPGRDPLSIDVTRPGTQCIASGKRPVLWRAASSRPATGTVVRAGTDQQGQIQWATGNHSTDWPQAVAAIGGARYVIRLRDRPQPTEIELKLVPTNLPSVGHQALWMNDQGCAEQARLLLQTED